MNYHITALLRFFLTRVTPRDVASASRSTEYLPNNRRGTSDACRCEEIADGWTYGERKRERTGETDQGREIRRVGEEKETDEGGREGEREKKKESASKHIATEDEKGDSRGRKTLGNSGEWDGGVGGMGDVVGTGETRRPARTPIGGGGRGSGPRGGRRRHDE